MSTSVAVNLSSMQFSRSNVPALVRDVLAATNLSANRLEIEITESTLLQDTIRTRHDLHQLERLGVKISLDDFGTAYSSLSYLHSFPFHKVKIDQSFLRGLVDDERRGTYSDFTSTAGWRVQFAFMWHPRSTRSLPHAKSFPTTWNLNSTPAKLSSIRPASSRTRPFRGCIEHCRTPQCASPVWRANTSTPINFLRPLGRSTRHFIGAFFIIIWFAKLDLTQD